MIANPRIFWARLKPRKHQSCDLDIGDLLRQLQKLYHIDGVDRTMPIDGEKLHITLSEVASGIKRLSNEKAGNATDIVAEMIKWADLTVYSKIIEMINDALTNGLPANWQMNRVTPIHKSEDTHDPSNYK